MIYKWIK